MGRATGVGSVATSLWSKRHRALAAGVALTFAVGALAADAPPSDGLEPFLEPSREPPPDQGVTVGARVGYGIPFGNRTGTPGAGLGDFMSGTLPLQLDVGYRYRKLYVGGFFQYAPAFVASSFQIASTAAGQPITCGATDVSCSGHVIRLGAEVQYAIAPRTRISPWVGLGFGYEWARVDSTTSAGSSGGTISGFEFADFQAGVDFPLGRGFRLGPYAMLTVAQYSSISATTTGAAGGTTSLSIDDKAFHEWLHLGVRVALDL